MIDLRKVSGPLSYLSLLFPSLLLLILLYSRLANQHSTSISYLFALKQANARLARFPVLCFFSTDHHQHIFNRKRLVPQECSRVRRRYSPQVVCWCYYRAGDVLTFSELGNSGSYVFCGPGWSLGLSYRFL